MCGIEDDLRRTKASDLFGLPGRSLQLIGEVITLTRPILRSPTLTDKRQQEAVENLWRYLLVASGHLLNPSVCWNSLRDGMREAAIDVYTIGATIRQHIPDCQILLPSNMMIYPEISEGHFDMKDGSSLQYCIWTPPATVESAGEFIVMLKPPFGDSKWHSHKIQFDQTPAVKAK